MRCAAKEVILTLERKCNRVTCVELEKTSNSNFYPQLLLFLNAFHKEMPLNQYQALSKTTNVSKIAQRCNYLIKNIVLEAIFIIDKTRRKRKKVQCRCLSSKIV